MKNHILVVGSANVDLVVKAPRIPQPGETIIGGDLQTFPGGKGANQAVAAARLGGAVVFIARVGDDEYGRTAIQGWQKEGINTSSVVLDSNRPTGTALIIVDHEGQNAITVASGANEGLSKEDLGDIFDQYNIDLVLTQLETPMETILHLVHHAHEKGVRVILNPAPANLLSDELLARLYCITHYIRVLQRPSTLMRLMWRLLILLLQEIFLMEH